MLDTASGWTNVGAVHSASPGPLAEAAALRRDPAMTALRLPVPRAAAARIAAPDGQPMLVLSDGATSPVLDGVRLAPGAMVLIPAGQTAYLRATAVGTWFAVTAIADAGWANALAPDRGGEVWAAVPGAAACRAVAAALSDWVDHAPISAAEVLLTMHAYLSAPSPARAGTRSRRALMDQFEQIMRHPRHRHPSMERLAEMLGVAPRTLRACVRDFVGIGPARYVHRHRLDVARERLLAADPRSNSVTALALALGFTELGRFSVAYRAQFGEPPSATLQRMPTPAPDECKGVESLLRLAA